YFLLFTFFGCEAFVRKFTRKPKKRDISEQEMVLVPEEYVKPQVSSEEQYRGYFLYWKSWQDELISSLRQGANHKKQIESVAEVIKNLEVLKELLSREDKRKGLEEYLAQSVALKESITKDAYGSSVATNRLQAERLKRNILRDFSYREIKDCLK
ncbi:MAG: hypothetical protein JW788_06035, partial [Candidatus Omnitrophica bacterium]|nr:hypothetical protein [Candidatus Omnitrophota bacterium]